MDEDAYKGCYIFKPAEQEDEDSNPRPQKKRKLSRKSTGTTDISDAWPRLLGGQESQAHATLRKDLFTKTWAKQQAKLDAVAGPFDNQVLVDLRTKIRQCSRKSLLAETRLQTVLLASNGSQNAVGGLEETLREGSDEESEIVVHLHPSQCSNLQTALKTLIRSSIVSHEDLEAYTKFLSEQKALVPMAFDFELLELYVNRHDIERVVISIDDVETFDTGILAELIATFHSWSDRVPIILLIGISTTVELFESRFSRATISLLDADVVSSSSSRSGSDVLFDIYATVQHGAKSPIFLGPAVVNVLAELAEDQGSTPDTMVRAIKYAFMSQFFANPLSALSEVDETTNNASWDPTTYKAIRSLSSFRTYCEVLSQGDEESRQSARSLLTSDETLSSHAKEAIASSKAAIRTSLAAVSTLRHIYHSILKLDKLTIWETEQFLLVTLPDLTTSKVWKAIEEALTFGPLATTTTTSSVLENDTDFTLVDFRDFCSAQEASISRPLLATLKKYLSARTIPSTDSGSRPEMNPFKSFLSEAHVISTKSPLSQILHPRPRAVIERALLKPADYLGCECCAPASNTVGDGGTDRSQLHPTSLLLAMLDEAGSIINVRDLWDTFRHTLSSAARDGDEDEGEERAEDASNERQALALFYRALAELRLLGFVKQSKKKPGVECLQKTVWMGL